MKERKLPVITFKIRNYSYSSEKVAQIWSASLPLRNLLVIIAWRVVVDVFNAVLDLLSIFSTKMSNYSKNDEETGSNPISSDLFFRSGGHAVC